jgi:hypothetical protein
MQKICIAPVCLSNLGLFRHAIVAFVRHGEPNRSQKASDDCTFLGVLVSG